MSKSKTFTGSGLMDFLNPVNPIETPTPSEEPVIEKPLKVKTIAVDDDDDKAEKIQPLVSPVSTNIPVMSILLNKERIKIENEKTSSLMQRTGFPADKTNCSIRLENDLYETLKALAENQNSRLGPFVRFILERPENVAPFIEKKYDSVYESRMVSKRKPVSLYIRKSKYAMLMKAAEVQETSVALVCNEILKRYLINQSLNET